MIRDIVFEAGFVTITKDSGPPVVLPTSFFLGGAVAQSDLGAAILDGTAVKLLATSNVIGGIPVMHKATLAAAALGNTDITLTHKTEVVDAWVQLTGAGVASTVLTVGSTGNIITNTFDVSGSDKAILRCTTIDNAYSTIAAGGIMRVTSSVGATQPACVVYVLCLRVA